MTNVKVCKQCNALNKKKSLTRFSLEPISNQIHKFSLYSLRDN